MYKYMYILYKLIYLYSIARIANSMVEFRFLNSSSPILIGQQGSTTLDEASEHQSLNAKLSDSPCGGNVSYNL